MSSSDERPLLQCFLALPYSPGYQRVKEAVQKGAKRAGFQVISADELSLGHITTIQENTIGALTRADCIIVDVTDRNPNVFFELGMAQAMDKAIFPILQKGTISNAIDGFNVIEYEPTEKGLIDLSSKVRRSLQAFRRSPSKARGFPRARLATPFSIDWDRLERTDAENLCLELLAQMGYQRIAWGKESREVDLIAELPKKDPDGFEYRELWFVAMGRNAPLDIVLKMASREPDHFLYRLFQSNERLERLMVRGTNDVPITLLLILLKGDDTALDFEQQRMRLTRQMKFLPESLGLRIRVWDRTYLSSLVQQFPQIGYKYFSDEGFFRLKTRKTYEELYKEYVYLNDTKSALIAALEDEKNKRVRAERDAVWRDISFTAAHKIGNPLFAIETFLDPLQKRVGECRTEESLNIIDDIRASVEKAKGIIDQFKSLARAQNIKPVPTLLSPILEDACRMVLNKGVECDIECPIDVFVEADPRLLAECFDELALNATHWFDKEEKRIQVQVSQPKRKSLPDSIDSSRSYILIHFKDNGTGIPIENKSRIFDAFYTTRDHGTGLGLAYVRRIIEGHGGTILESGLPGEGADFEIYLPLCRKASDTQASDIKSKNAK